MKEVSLKKIKGMAVAVVLAAFAISLTLPVRAAGKKTTVYVVTQIRSKDNTGGTECYKMTYNSKGLVTKTTVGEAAPTTTEHIYKNGRIVKDIQTDGKEKTEIRYSYNKKGRITKIIGTDNDGKEYVSTLKYKKGMLAQMKDGSTGYIWTFTNKKGLARKLVIKGTDGKKQTIRYSYDSKKEISKMDCPDVIQKMKYKYSSNRRKSMTVSYEYKNKADQKYNSKSTYKYTYKKMKVSSANLSKIKKQQKQLLNQGGAFLFVVDY